MKRHYIRAQKVLEIMNVTPVLLIILDGFGYREECSDNAICQARKPHWNFYWKTCPHTTIDASERWVACLPRRWEIRRSVI